MPKYDNMRFGDSLSQILRNRRVSQKDLAKALGVTTATVNNWCNGHCVPAGDNMASLTSLLGVSANDLYNGSEVPYDYQDFRGYMLREGLTIGDLISAIKEWQDVERGPSSKDLERVARHLRISVEDLLSEGMPFSYEKFKDELVRHGCTMSDIIRISTEQKPLPENLKNV